MPNDIKYSVIIPVYNSTESLTALIGRLNKVFSEEIKEPYEVVMVDDDSPNPDTWSTLERLAATNPNLKIIKLMRNFGKAGALLCGFSEAKGEYIVTMDDDLQNRPEDIPILLNKDEHDVVIGSTTNKKHGWFVLLSSKISAWFDQIILGKPRHIKNSPLKLIKAEVAKAMLEIKTPYPYIIAMIFNVTKDVVSIEVSHDERVHGKPGFTFKKRLGLFLRLLINNSSLLLQAVAGIGVSMALFSVIYSAYLIYKRLFYGIHVSGWTSIMVILLITSGLVLFSLGVIGEYLIRIINTIEHRPVFIIRKKVG